MSRLCSLALLLAAPLAFGQERAVIRSYFASAQVEPTYCEVTEVLWIERALEGAPGEAIPPAGLLIRLPPDAIRVEVGSEGTVAEEGGIRVTGPIGSGRQVRFRYELRTSTGVHRIQRQLPLPAMQARGLVPEGQIIAQAEGWRMTRAVTKVDGQQLPGPHIFFENGKLSAGHLLTMTLTPEAAHNPLGWMYVCLVALVLLGFALLQIGLWLEWRAKAARERSTRAHFVAESEALEKAASAGQVKGAYLKARRKQLKQQLDE